MMQSFTRREVHQLVAGLEADTRETENAMQMIRPECAAYAILQARLEMNRSIQRKLNSVLSEVREQRIAVKSY